MHKDFAVHVVDDDPGVRESIKTLVSTAGFRVYSYSSGTAFLERCQSARGCALVDLRLGDMTGIELQKSLIARQASVDVILVSAFGDIGRAVEAMRLGAVDFIEKPFDPDLMLDKLGKLARTNDISHQLQRDARQHAALIDTLTPREKQVMRGIVEGRANKQVAGDLGISARTVETHRVHIMQKMQADSLAHLVRLWLVSARQQPEQELPAVS
ncbi:response regulator [Salinisphaera sp. SPP-AMP-43]|uniref:response regulator transcription factor n=1 Tax=Salinisphaera sp. SPP-AMP-43 TaxID=3121288 RepID=UPI003C6DF80D